jgi:hypothetical protein
MSKLLDIQAGEMDKETNEKYGNAPGPLHPMHLLTYPGLPLLGFLVTCQDRAPVFDVRAMVPCIGVLVTIIVSIVLAARPRSGTRASYLGLAAALGVLLGALAGGWRGWGPATAFVIPCAAVMGLYTSILWYWLKPAHPAPPYGGDRWIPLIIMAIFTAGAATHAFALGRMPWGIKILSVYLVMWGIARTYYFCRALRGRPSRELVEQACSEMLKGLLLLEGAGIAGLVNGPASLASIPLPFVLMPLAALLSPWKIRRR